MDRTSLIGVLLGIIGVGVGMVMKGVSASALLNPAAILIILVGTAASVTIAFPGSTLKKVPQLFKIIFKEDKNHDVSAIIGMFIKWAEVARREGLLALEKEITEVDDPFLVSGLNLVIDGQTTEFIRDVLVEKVEAMEERHQSGAAIFSQAGTYAPTLGVLGAVVGLIAALSHMDDTVALGHAISAAFIATLLGIFTGYVLWHPFANKLKEKSKKEANIKYIMIEGILSITKGESPVILKDKLGSYLSSSELAKLEEKPENE